MANSQYYQVCCAYQIPLYVHCRPVQPGSEASSELLVCSLTGMPSHIDSICLCVSPRKFFLSIIIMTTPEMIKEISLSG